MDVEWAIEQLRRYLHLHERVPVPPEEARPNRKTRVRGSADELRNAQHVARAIAAAVYKDPPRHIGAEFVHQMIWVLEDGDEVRARLGLDEPAPAIAADSLHPWVWEAARPHWTSGNHTAAVWAASVNVNSWLQRKVGRRQVSEGALITECFSLDDPEPGRPRLRLCDKSNPSLFKDMHQGAMFFGRGLYAGVRNPLNHVPEDEHLIGEPEALEALAAFSLFARWISRADVAQSDDEAAESAGD
jgi:Protein of unknown function (Hypoth_ymh)